MRLLSPISNIKIHDYSLIPLTTKYCLRNKPPIAQITKLKYHFRSTTLPKLPFWIMWIWSRDWKKYPITKESCLKVKRRKRVRNSFQILPCIFQPLVIPSTRLVLLHLVPMRDCDYTKVHPVNPKQIVITQKFEKVFDYSRHMFIHNI